MSSESKSIKIRDGFIQWQWQWCKFYSWSLVALRGPYSEKLWHVNCGSLYIQSSTGLCGHSVVSNLGYFTDVSRVDGVYLPRVSRVSTNWPTVTWISLALRTYHCPSLSSSRVSSFLQTMQKSYMHLYAPSVSAYIMPTWIQRNYINASKLSSYVTWCDWINKLVWYMLDQIGRASCRERV